MEVFYTSRELKQRLSEIKTQSGRVGFVPTMGSLHSGHASLLDQAKRESDFVVLSIFVNPTQFDSEKDFVSYPVSLERDLALARSLDVDAVFVPETTELYEGVPAADSVDYGNLTNSFEGALRTGHFDGVVAIVRRLFSIVNPSKAFFGEKDLQQLAVVRELCNREFTDLEIVPCELIRDTDGLALSSRNIRLSVGQRVLALELFHSLNRLRSSVSEVSSEPNALSRERERLNRKEGIELEYIGIIDARTFDELGCENWRNGHAVIAANLGSVRLIDNLFLGDPGRDV
tara:strand:+ start:3406 stop:4269 length:864 start_codon:yes stop_codon:yes gene_type:complete